MHCRVAGVFTWCYPKTATMSVSDLFSFNDLILFSIISRCSPAPVDRILSSSPNQNSEPNTQFRFPSSSSDSSSPFPTNWLESRARGFYERVTQSQMTVFSLRWFWLVRVIRLNWPTNTATFGAGTFKDEKVKFVSSLRINWWQWAYLIWVDPAKLVLPSS